MRDDRAALGSPPTRTGSILLKRFEQKDVILHEPFNNGNPCCSAGWTPRVSDTSYDAYFLSEAYTASSSLDTYTYPDVSRHLCEDRGGNSRQWHLCSTSKYCTSHLKRLARSEQLSRNQRQASATFFCSGRGCSIKLTVLRKASAAGSSTICICHTGDQNRNGESQCRVRWTNRR